MDPLAIVEQIRTDYPKMSAAALITAGAVLGWAAGWLFFRQQLATYRTKLEHLQEVIDGKLPQSTYRPIRFRKGRSMIAGLVVLICGLAIAVIGTVILLQNVGSTPNKTGGTPSVAETAPTTPMTPAVVPAAPVVPAPVASPPSTIQWNPSFGMMRAGNSTAALLLNGTSLQSKSVTLKDAFLESGITGEVIKMKIAPNTPNLPQEAFPISEANPLPPKGYIRLIAVMNTSDFTLGIPDKELLERWRTIWFNAAYENEKPDRILFNMEQYFPDIAGPHATRKTP